MTTVTVSEDIQGKAADVWAAISDFGGIKVGGPVTSFEIEGEGVGMVRTIGMGGGQVVERLDLHDADAMVFSYSIINEDCPLPVADYSATVEVSDNGDDTTRVTWTGTFEPRGASEADASKVVEGIYKGGIAGARKAVEG
ncbi:MAG: SRPBCC family protein [Gammaproteobacteria bacterium]|nr:SRPBCC family protein [Gammaproteobacteria bacterium]